MRLRAVAAAASLIVLGLAGASCSSDAPPHKDASDPPRPHASATPHLDVPSPGTPVRLNARGIPLQRGALVGAAYGANSNPAPLEAQLGGRLEVRRTFWRADQVDRALAVASADVAHDRIPWLSFKLAYSWAEVAQGRDDDWVRDLATRLGQLPGPVWIAFHHEPETDGPIRDWTAMQAHLAPLVRETADNVAYTIILTGYAQLFGPIEYSLDHVWPSNTLVDLVGFDIYNKYGVVGKDGLAQQQETDLLRQYFEPLSAWAEQHQVAWGLSETGVTDQAAVVHPDALGRMYRALSASGGSVFCYFDSRHNARASWPLSSPEKAEQYAAVLRAGPEVVRVGPKVITPGVN